MSSVVGKPLPIFPGDALEILKGDPIDSLPVKGVPNVVELWATWCGPCRAVFPHLSEIQKKFKPKGLRVIGVCLEDPSPTLKSFVHQQGDKMHYTVAVDPKGVVGQKLMEFAGVTGIPHAFVVDKAGIIAYSGHPMQPEFKKAIDKVCSAAEPQPEKQPLPKVTQSREELSHMPVKELKKILEDRKIPLADLNEKGELVDRIVERCTNVMYYG
ncbi:hypothetical protein WJX72_007129 [[Myrmecia] bisecta]|uniref:Thioredoxin domain-containing protein n=1 Tax=[Myrmecia] bisecta TaxID=41462 RepID=A0AAW1P8E5_9CHLO